MEDVITKHCSFDVVYLFLHCVVGKIVGKNQCEDTGVRVHVYRWDVHTHKLRALSALDKFVIRVIQSADDIESCLLFMAR